MKYLFLFIIVLLVIACTSKPKSSSERDEANDLASLVIIDSTLSLRTHIHDDSNPVSTPLYIGVERDTIIVDHTIYPRELIPDGEMEPGNDYQQYFSKHPADSAISGALSIYVSTKQVVGIGMSTGYPVIIKNISNDTLCLGTADRIPIVQEILSQDTIWTQYYIPRPLICGTGLHFINLPPKQILVTAIPAAHKKGLYKSRVSYNGNYSNEFMY